MAVAVAVWVWVWAAQTPKATLTGACSLSLCVLKATQGAPPNQDNHHTERQAAVFDFHPYPLPPSTRQQQHQARTSMEIEHVTLVNMWISKPTYSTITPKTLQTWPFGHGGVGLLGDFGPGRAMGCWMQGCAKFWFVLQVVLLARKWSQATSVLNIPAISGFHLAIA